MAAPDMTWSSTRKTFGNSTHSVYLNPASQNGIRHSFIIASGSDEWRIESIVTVAWLAVLL